MSYELNPYYSGSDRFAAAAAADEGSQFITKTYLHLAGAIAAFVGLEAFLLPAGHRELMQAMAVSKYGWLIVIGLFMLSVTSPKVGHIGNQPRYAICRVWDYMSWLKRSSSRRCCSLPIRSTRKLSCPRA